jgi:hypothetical protein
MPAQLRGPIVVWDIAVVYPTKGRDPGLDELFRELLNASFDHCIGLTLLEHGYFLG